MLGMSKIIPPVIIQINSKLPKRQPIPRTNYQLFCRYFNVDQQNENGDTPLHIGVKIDSFSSRYNICSLILSCGKANPDLTDKRGRTPLHTAAIFNNVKMAQLLLQKGNANANIPDKDGRVAFHTAVENNCEEMVQLLIKVGADPNICDKEGNKPLDLALAQSNKNERLIELLKKAGATSSQTHF